MKRLLPFLLVLLLCLTGCETAPQTPVSSQDSGITQDVYKALPLPDLYLEIPSDYTTTSSQFYEEYYVKDDASIIVTQDSSAANPESMRDYAVAALVQYENAVGKLDVHNDEMVYAGNLGVQLLEFTYAISPEEDASKLTCMIGYLSDGASVYIITCKSSADTYQNHRDDFLQVMQSAAFVK